MIVSMAHYGLKYSSPAFHAHLAKTWNEIGFLSAKVDPDVWYGPAVKPNGFKYHMYNLCYAEDIMCISNGLGIVLGQIQAVFKFKVDNMEHPKIYLGDRVRKMIVYGEEGWYMSAEKYVRYAIDNVQ